MYKRQLVLLVLLISVGVLWKRLHRDQRPNPVEGPTILQQELTGTEWNTISYTPARRLSVQTQADGTTAMDFRLAAQPASEAVDRSWFSDVWFLGDSLTQGMQMYENGLPNAHFCAYKGVEMCIRDRRCTDRSWWSGGQHELPASWPRRWREAANEPYRLPAYCRSVLWKGSAGKAHKGRSYGRNTARCPCGRGACLYKSVSV